ncbi:FAD/NAD(P)-binding protein [Streptacidiphilus sp. N1-12]|uniref:FAD/NAD(P)-binding protein n=2 Tax=Streptacidiphilus alkalitolerans TaxID=3342712 RepID=A0ABV6V7I6_9ACTN
MQPRKLDVCIVGAGPRGVSVLERLCANERHSPSADHVTVHLIDPAQPGSGQVWRTGQSRHLLMNTVASQVTVYTDESVDIEGPICGGPSLYAWARQLLAENSKADPDPAFAGYDDGTLAEARDLGPDSYPTRAFYGLYLTWAYQQLTATAPDHVTVVAHRTRATALDDDEAGTQTVRLADGTVLAGLDAVVLAQGHVPAEPTRQERELTAFARRHGLRYLPPANPADLDLSAAAPGQPVLLRGLGLNFFDHMALFTVGRGGTFERVDGALVYRPSGREPKLYAGSRRGIPFHARGDNQKGAHGRYFPRLLTPALIAELRARAEQGARIDFSTELWPLIAKEVESVYYGALLVAQGRQTEKAEFVNRYLYAPAGTPERYLLHSYGIAPEQRWTWTRLGRPYGDRTFADQADFRGWLLDYLRNDLAEARGGNIDSPLKAALDVMRDLRNEIRIAVDHGGLDGYSHREHLESWYTPFNGFLSIGPPASRIEEMIALIEAGVLEVVLPGTRFLPDEAKGAFVTVNGDAVAGEQVRANVLIEARLPEPDLRRTADPLLRHLLETGQCRAFTVPGYDGQRYETGGLEVSARPNRVVDHAGHVHPRRFAYGVPTEAVHWVTAAGIRPGVNSVTLVDSDAIAQAIRSLPTALPAALRIARNAAHHPTFTQAEAVA